MLNKKVLIGLFILLVIVAFLYQRANLSQIKVSDSSNQTSTTDTNKPDLVSTNPLDLSERSAVSPTQIIELKFNIPLENVGEFKYKIDPKAEVKIELSSDRKIVKISPVSTFKLGTTYQIEIFPDSKFNIDPTQKSTQKTLERTLFVKFRTIEYRGV